MRNRVIRGSWGIVVCCIALAASGCSKSESASGDKQGKSAKSAPESAQPAPSKPAEPKTDQPSAAAGDKAGDSPTPVEPAADKAGAADHADKRMVEVEVFGTITGRPDEGRLFIYGAAGDCLADDAHILEKVMGNDSFMIEVFAPWGTELTLCAAVDPGNDEPAVWYGKWKEPLLAEGEGEVVFRDIAIELAKHEPHVFPAVQRPVFE